MMQEQYTIQQIRELTARVAQLEAMIKAETPKPQPTSLLPSVVDCAYSRNLTLYCRDYPESEKYLKAFVTLLDLRRQPGTVPVRDQPPQACIELMRDGKLKVINSMCGYQRYSQMSPHFETDAQAEAAVKAVGEQRIVEAFRTLQGL